MADLNLKGKRQRVADPEAHFWSHVDQSGGPDACWPWILSLKPNGYGQAVMQQRRWMTHVFAYVTTYGPIPAGLHLDHTCHNNDLSCAGGPTCVHRRCCNPVHLEAVTPAQNKARADAPRERTYRTHCPHGHVIDGTKIRRSGPRAGKVERYCRTCYSIDQTKRKAVSLSKKG